MKKNGTGGISLPDFRLSYKLQSLRQRGAGTRTEIQTNGTRQKTQRQTHTLTGTITLTKEARIYSGEKTAPSVSSARVSGQLHVKE